VSDRPRLAVLAVLAAGGAAFGGYYLWPSGRHVAACVHGHAVVPTDTQKALDAYAGRIRHDVQRALPGRREESWQDPLTGRSRQLTYEHGRLTFAYGTAPTSGIARSVWVDYRGRVWMSRALRLPGKTRVANAAAEEAQASRDKVVRGKASIVGTEAVRGTQTLHLQETLRPERTMIRGIGPASRVHLPPQPIFHVDTWVDPLTYVTVRTRFTVTGHSSVSDETWLPRTPANVAATRIVVPDGFRHELERGNVLTSIGRASFSCA
jgi:hypothetical protein